MRSIPILLFLFIFAGTAAAEPWQLSRARQQPFGFLSGFLSGYAAHELGHIIVAEAKGFDAEFDGVTLVYPKAQMSDAEHLQIASSGFQVQWILSETALRCRKENKLSAFGDSFNAGAVVSHLAITAAYLTVLRNHDDGDLKGVAEATGYSTRKLAALVAVPAILDTWRLFGKEVPEWVPAVSLGAKAGAVTWIWTY